MNACIKGHNNKAASTPSIEDCIELCQDEKSFQCVSIDYNPTGKNCQLSTLNMDSAGSYYTAPCHFPGWLYAEQTQYPGKLFSFGSYHIQGDKS